jgi:hypothetical protein
MKKLSTRIISFLLVLVMLLSFGLTACTPSGEGGGEGEGEGGSGDGGWQIPEGEYTIPKEPGHNQITFYWSHPGVIENCDIWAWWDGKEGSGYVMHPCEYGARSFSTFPSASSRSALSCVRDAPSPAAPLGARLPRMRRARTASP